MQMADHDGMRFTKSIQIVNLILQSAKSRKKLPVFRMLRNMVEHEKDLISSIQQVQGGGWNDI